MAALAARLADTFAGREAGGEKTPDGLIEFLQVGSLVSW